MRVQEAVTVAPASGDGFLSCPEDGRHGQRLAVMVAVAVMLLADRDRQRVAELAASATQALWQSLN